MGDIKMTETTANQTETATSEKYGDNMTEPSRFPYSTVVVNHVDSISVSNIRTHFDRSDGKVSVEIVRIVAKGRVAGGKYFTHEFDCFLSRDDQPFEFTVNDELIDLGTENL